MVTIHLKILWYQWFSVAGHLSNRATMNPSTPLLCITLYYSVLLCITLYYSVLFCITLYYSVLLCTTLYF
jgi:hypothetical protein